MPYKVSDARRVVLLAVVLRFGACLAGEASEERVEVCDQHFTVEGHAFVQGVRTEDWVATAAVLLDGGEHIGFIRLDGSFTVNDVAPGSYVLHVASPTYRFEPVRVDVTTQGKIRARKVNYIKPYEVVQLSYPLLMKCSGLHSYFIARETWALSDFLMNPMVLMMVLPLVIILLLPKVMDAEGQAMTREMEESMNRLNNPTFPDVSELMAKYFNPPRNQSKPGRKARGHRGGSPRRK